VKCHGADGTGRPARASQPDIPDFTNASWQRRQSEARLRASILDGKGDDMPPFRRKISAEQARGLAAHVRAFGQTAGGPEQEQQGEPTADESAEKGDLPRSFAEKLIAWLGNFHPPAVHFPIALLMAAAVAELLRLVTGKSAFEPVTRFCVWFGSLTAVGAGILGWFCGGFRLADPNWVLTAHRWLGTATVACAGLVLLLFEVSRRPNGHRSHRWARLALLVAAVLISVTGFFGGAVVFGLDHYSWPP
jgi:uncharacterized membrane protein